MGKTRKKVEGSISKELKEVPAFLAEKLGIKEDKSPQAVYNMCKKEGLYCELDFSEDKFLIMYYVEDKPKEEVPEEAPVAPTGTTQEVKLDDDDFDFLGEGGEE